LKKEHGVEMSKSGVSRMLKHLGLSPQRPIYPSDRSGSDRRNHLISRQKIA